MSETDSNECMTQELLCIGKSVVVDNTNELPMLRCKGYRIWHWPVLMAMTMPTMLLYAAKVLETVFLAHTATTPCHDATNREATTVSVYKEEL